MIATSFVHVLFPFPFSSVLTSNLIKLCITDCECVCPDPGGAVEAVEHGGVPGGGGRTLPLPLADTRPSSQVSTFSRDYISKQWADLCFSMELVVLRLQYVAEIFWPSSPTGTRTCDPRIRGSNRAVSEW